jgi:hypothetical protein
MKDVFVMGALLMHKAGLTSSNYHRQMNRHNFEKWVKQKSSLKNGKVTTQHNRKVDGHF